MTTSRERQLLRFADRTLLWGSVFFGIVLSALYVWLDGVQPVAGTAGASLRSLFLAVIPNFIPVSVLAELAYITVRKIQSIRKAVDRD